MHTSWKYINPDLDPRTGISSEKKQKAIFLDRDGVINVERSYIRTPEDFDLYPFTAKAIKKINESDFLAIVVTNQSMIAQNIGTLDQLEKIHEKLDTELAIHEAYIDAIYFCPHHPKPLATEINAKFRFECKCRKPKHGMFLHAAKDFNIDLKQSFMIGDTERDIAAGRNAGCKAIGVNTGYGLKDAEIEPDNKFSNLDSAVSHILQVK